MLRTRKSPPGPQTNLQRRLRHIAEECDSIIRSYDAGHDVGGGDIRTLAYHVSYLAGIIEKHFRENER